MCLFLPPVEMHQLHPHNTMGIRLKPKIFKIQKILKRQKKQKKQQKQVPATNFPFFSLPPELRIQIYEWAILQKQTHGPIRTANKSSTLEHLPGYGHGPLAESAITRVSRLTRMESLPIFYKLRRFPLLSLPLQTKNPSYRDHEEPKLNSWMKKIDPAKFTMMKSFVVELHVPHHHNKDNNAQFFMSIDIKGRGHDIWFGKAWDDGGYRHLEKYWTSVVTRKGSGVREIVTRLQAVLAKLGYVLTREDILRLAQEAMKE
ncbi:hypothetical protein BDV97DRAFT_127509 [Delphinella strobiligena]|nr:hypothetical protein BDV97DRAFT_127509 [Delphinella strobiligena]